MAVDSYEVPAGPVHLEIPRIKGSRFIADAFPVSSPERAEANIETVRKTYHDATHHCFAYRLGASGEPWRSSDDGEPSGSAGIPILRQIESSGLSDTLVVVTRYFGGTKLGTGGLARAYAAAARTALGSVERRTRRLYSSMNLTFSYDDTAPVMRLVERFQAQVVSSRYSDVTELTVEVPLSTTGAFVESFVEDLGGRGELRRLH